MAEPYDDLSEDDAGGEADGEAEPEGHGNEGLGVVIEVGLPGEKTQGQGQPRQQRVQEHSDFCVLAAHR